MERARGDAAAYSRTLSAELKTLVCSGGGDAIYILRGEGFRSRIFAAGTAASDLISVLVNKDSKDCPVAAALTDADRANLLQIKQRIEKAAK